MTTAPPEPSPWATLNELAVAVAEATRKVDEDRRINERRIRASVQKMRWFRRAAILGVLAAGVAIWAGWSARTAVDDLRTQRTSSRIATCHADNANAGRINALNDRSQQLLRNAVEGSSTRTPEQQANAELFLNNELASYQAIKVPLRRCDPASIAAFYRTK